MVDATLTKPTVKEVIDFLSLFDPDTPFRLEDPDTSWTISTVHWRVICGVLFFTGEYPEMNEGG
jgi:hypothetical protein